MCIGGGGLQRKVLFRARWNLVFCVSGLIQGWGMQGECKISSCHLFVSDVNQGNEDFECKNWVQNFLVWPQGWKGFPEIFCKLLNRKHLQSSSPFLWHPFLQKPQGFKFQNSTPSCDPFLTGSKTLLQVITSLLAYHWKWPTTAHHLAQPPHHCLPENRIPQWHLNTSSLSQTNISISCSHRILSMIATDTFVITIQPYPSQSHLPTVMHLLIK